METKTGQCFRSLLSNQYDAVGDRLETVPLTEDFNFLRSFTSFTVTSFTCSFVAVFTCTWLTSTKSLTSDLVLRSNSVIWSQSHFYLSIKPAPTKYTCVIFSATPVILPFHKVFYSVQTFTIRNLIKRVPNWIFNA